MSKKYRLNCQNPGLRQQKKHAETERYREVNKYLPYFRHPAHIFIPNQLHMAHMFFHLRNLIDGKFFIPQAN